jgi:hypothetical protein
MSSSWSDELLSRSRRFVVGFTGTHHGMSHRQQDAVSELLALILPDELRHGDCVGADFEFHCIGLAYACFDIVVHPPIKEHARAYASGPRVTVLPPEPFLKRDLKIVLASDVMIAAPFKDDPPRALRGQGTWTTIGYARKHGFRDGRDLYVLPR